jgi:hypothetical protein
VTAPLKPVDTFTEAYPLLRRPFTPAAVRFKIQATFNGGAMAVAFIDARLVAGRLNAVCPALWSATYERPENGKGLICHLTVDGITRTDFGVSDYENAKGDYSDALKRAAVQFGVGESLYVLPKMFLKEGNLLKPIKRGNKTSYALTPQGEAHCRMIYTDWLEQSGKATFGDPLDHGDQVFDVQNAAENVQTSDEGAGSGNAPDRSGESVDRASVGASATDPPAENVTPSSELSELAQLVAEVGFSEEELDALREWIKQDKETHTATAIDLLRDGNKAAILAGIEYEVAA